MGRRLHGALAAEVIRRRAALPALLGAGWLLALFLPLLPPDRALASRDIAQFHLPLRVAFARLAHGGLPVWNPWLHGGQPILSNPTYAAFYPPTWLGLVLPPAYALSLSAVLHAALAFAGAWVLARRLGCGRGAAALAAVGFTGSGAWLSLLNAIILLYGLAWFPWVLAACDAVLKAPARAWLRPALLGALAVGLQLLNAEPVTILITGLGVFALAVPALRRPAAVLRLAVPYALGLALAAVQILPLAGRIADSPRGGGLDAAAADIWSAPPARVVELAFPRFFGDPAAPREGRFFGWNLHDRDYPYLASLYPGLLVTVLGIAALALWPVPRRAALLLAVTLGAFLAVGRHNPWYDVLRRALPPFAMVRFPEKYALLAVGCLAFAAALGWQRLMAEREAGRRAAADFPLALSLVLCATALVLTGLLYRLPQAALFFIRRHGGPALQPADALAGLAVLRGEAWAAVLTAAAVALLFALCRARRPSARALSAAAVALLAADLWHYGHGLVATLPAAEYRDPPPLARDLQRVQPPESRLYVPPPREGQPEPVPRGGDPRLAPARAVLARLGPYAGSLWGVHYALDADYELMLTGWGRLAMTVIDAERKLPDPALAERYLGAWNVGALLVHKPPQVWAAEVAHDPAAVPVRPVRNPYLLPRYRFVPRVGFHDSIGSALYLTRGEGYQVDRHEHAVRSWAPPSEESYAEPPRALALADDGGQIRLHYRGAGPAFFTVATTYDEGWRATVDGRPVPTYLTGMCQLGVGLPAGEHRLLLAYRERLLGPGAAVTSASLLLFAFLAWRTRARVQS